jgi:hypothetical protein
MNNNLEIEKIVEENKILKLKINQIYKYWLFDSDRYKELKEKYSTVLVLLKNNNNKN